MEIQKPELISLNIPSNWTIFKTRFYDVSPDAKNKPKISTHDDGWFIFETELLILQYEKLNYYLDLGWYPKILNENEFSIADGQYEAKLVDGEGWKMLEDIYHGRSTKDAAEAINKKMLEISIKNNDYNSYSFTYKLQHLIPASGWRFVKNEFFDINPRNVFQKINGSYFMRNY